jgi:succinyl-diaminopimelate desuccinylase
MAETLAKMIGIRAISPEIGGAGESMRADFLQKLLEKWGFETRRYDYVDNTKTKRPNIIAKFGKCKRTVWVLTHMDTVSEGERSLWKTDPFKAKIADGKVYGRGSSDDGQALIASIFALRALKESHAKIGYNLGVALCADEEMGGGYGSVKLAREGIFRKDDLLLVSDFGGPRGDKIEVAEKGILWVKITVKGKQVHASQPQLGINAYRHSIRMLDYMDDYLHRKYSKRDRLYSEPSTFEMTSHEKNVDSTNIVPGMEVLYLDCRILPEYKISEVIADIRRIAKMKRFGKAKVKVEIKNMEPSPAVRGKSEIASMIESALKDLRGIRAKHVGTGGGTDARPFRERGMKVAVWATQDDVAHQPNEYARTWQMVADAKVFAYLCLPPARKGF